MAEINIWKPDSKDGSKERNSHLGINIAAHKKEWKYWMGGGVVTSYLGKTREKEQLATLNSLKITYFPFSEKGYVICKC